MPYTPEEVFKAFPERNIGGTRRWSTVLQRSVDGIFATLHRLLTEARDPTADERQELASYLRTGSSFSKNRLPPLFLSSGFIRLHSDRPEDQAWVANLCLDEEGDRFEHVIPLDFTLDGSALASDPAAAIGQPGEIDGAPEVPAFLTRLARCLLTPVCYLSRHEDLRIHRLDPPDWTRPFSRYVEPGVVRDAPDHPIEIYEGRQGTLIEHPGNYTWGDYIEALRQSDDYRDGLEWVERLDLYLAEKHGETLRLIREWQRRSYQRRARSEGGYTADERFRLRGELAHLLHRADAPKTLCGKPAIQIPVNRDRLTVAVLAPQQNCARQKDRLAFRFLIGGDYSTRKLYWNESEMHPEGRMWIEQVAQQFEAIQEACRNGSFTRDSNVPLNGFALKLPFPRDRQKVPVDKMSEALPALISAISTLYPTWAEQQA